VHPVDGLAGDERIGWLEAGVGRVVFGGADEERGVGRTERPASADVRSAENRVADALDEPDVGGHAPLAGPHL
jgi:hypothetical protein